MTVKIIIIAFFLLQAILGAIAQKRAADKKKREREEALRRGLPTPTGSDADEDEFDEDEEPNAKRESGGLGDLFDIFKDEGAKRPEPPPPLGSPGSARSPNAGLPTGPIADEAPRPTTIRLPNGILIELPTAPAPPRTPVPASAPPVPAQPQRVARVSGLRQSTPRQPSERQQELARRAAVRQASWSARHDSWNARKKRTSSRKSAINPNPGQPKVASTKTPLVNPNRPEVTPRTGTPNATAAAVRKAFEDPRQLRTSFVLSEIFRPPPGVG